MNWPPAWMESTRACSEWMCAVDKWTGRDPGRRTQSRQIHGQTVEICQPPGNVRGHLEVKQAALPSPHLLSLSFSFFLFISLSHPPPTPTSWLITRTLITNEWALPPLPRGWTAEVKNCPDTLLPPAGRWDTLHWDPHGQKISAGFHRNRVAVMRFLSAFMHFKGALHRFYMTKSILATSFRVYYLGR